MIAAVNFTMTFITVPLVLNPHCLTKMFPASDMIETIGFGLSRIAGVTAGLIAVIRVAILKWRMTIAI